MNQKLGLEELIMFCNNKNELRFSYNILKNKLYFKSREDVEDILQEGIARAFEWIHTEKGQSQGFSSVRGFILKTCMNYNTDLLRARKVHEKNSSKVDFKCSEILTPCEELIEKEHLDRQSKMIEKGLTILPDEQKRIIQYQLDEIDFNEMVVLEGTNINTLLSRGHYARKKMAKLLNPAA